MITRLKLKYRTAKARKAIEAEAWPDAVEELTVRDGQVLDLWGTKYSTVSILLTCPEDIKEEVYAKIDELVDHTHAVAWNPPSHKSDNAKEES